MDHPTAVLTTLIFSFKKVIHCKPRKNQDLNAFVSRFRPLAADYLMLVGMSTSLPVSNFLAITRFENAMLSEETVTNTKVQLLVLVEGRKDSDTDPKLHIKKSAHSLLLGFFGNLDSFFV